MRVVVSCEDEKDNGERHKADFIYNDEDPDMVIIKVERKGGEDTKAEIVAEVELFKDDLIEAIAAFLNAVEPPKKRDEVE